MGDIIIFGATGQTGQQLVYQGLDRGYHVRAFVRNPNKLSPQANLNIIQGDVLNGKEVAAAMQGVSAVLVALGSGNDRSKFRTEATQTIVNAMDIATIKRLIVQTSLGVGDSRQVVPAPMRMFLLDVLLKHAILDHESQEEVIKTSDTEWTIARPGRLTNGPKTGHYQIDVQPGQKFESAISRADVADFMLNEITDRKYIDKAVVLSY